MPSLVRAKSWVGLSGLVFLLAGCGSESSSSDSAAATKGAPGNLAPVVSAGADQSVAENATVSLSGSASDSDGTIKSVQWKQLSGPTAKLSDKNTPTVSFVAPEVAQQPAILVFQFSARDNRGAESSDEITIVVNDTTVNQPPTADAGADLMVDEGQSAQLDGRGSRDPDGSITSYRWQQTAGPDVTLSGADTATPGFTAPEVSGDQVLTFELKVTDDAGAADTDEVQVTALDARIVSIADAQVQEDGGALELTVTVTPAAGRAITVDYATADVTARDGSDYAGGLGTLTIPPGGESALIVIPITADTFDENDETFTVGLANANGATLGNSLATVTIRDDDTSNLLRIGAAKRSITPTQAQIDGIQESRALGVATHLQKFNLGGFGLNPLSNLPDDPLGAIPLAGAALTEPASRRVFTNSRGVEEHTNVRVLAVEEQSGDFIVFVMIDAVGAGNIIQNRLKEAVIGAAAQRGVTLLPQNILFGQTHSHAGADLQGLWGGVPQQWIAEILYNGAAEAAGAALDARQPAHLSFRQGHTTEFNNYRRPRIDPNADADGTLTLLTAVADDGTPVGSILQYNAHPTSINTGVRPRTPHADYIQGAMEWLEDSARLGGVGLYYNGPIADASGSGSRPGCGAGADGKFGEVRCRGEGIADYLLHPENVLAGRELAPTVESRSVEVILPITNPAFLAAAGAGAFNRYYNFTELPVDQIPGVGPQAADDLPQVAPVAITTVSRVTLGGAGGLEIVTIPGETTNTMGNYIRGLAGTNVMLLGLTHNSFGYILPEEEFSYVDQEGDDGLLLPFTGYEENVSLGPLTAPLLRTEGYNVLFDAAPERNIPPTLSSCLDQPGSSTCILTVLDNRLTLLMDGLEICVESGLGARGCPFETTIGFFTDGLDTIAEGCGDFGGPEEFCGLFEQASQALAGTGTGENNNDELLPLAAQAAIAGCDMLDPAHCLFPFPSDHFTVAAPSGSPQSEEKGGTGRRINFSPLAMPRNAAGKPIDPTEWNRSDGFSPGQMIVTYVPGLAVNQDGTIPGAPTITEPGRSLDLANSPVLVLDAETGEPHPVWAEIDLNAGTQLFVPVREVSDNPEDDFAIPRPTAARAPLIIRPAVNFKEGRRYVALLRNLKDGAGQTIAAQSAFRVCRDQLPTLLPPAQQRCDALTQNVFPVLDQADVRRDGTLYLAWDFTVASAENNIGRLRHMRDDAFINHLGQVEDAQGKILALGRAPGFTVDKVTLDPGKGMAKRIEGTITVPSYVVPVDPSPLEDPTLQNALNQLCANAPQDDLRSGCEELLGVAGIAQGGSLPPNRLFYNPLDNPNPADPQGQLFGDGLPDSVGTMTTRFICQIPPQASPGNPARPGIYGHGLLDSRAAITYDQVPEFSRDHNFLFCAVDLFGFATGDLPSVVSQTLDLSLFPVIPDASQQGLLNFLFLARLLVHPDGFAAHPEFQQDGQPLFDRREAFYDGNSQGGIVGGAVVAASKDVNRGVLGVVGMNYSTLLARSVDFDIFSVPLYLAYPDELDRNLGFALIQMMWDRSENNGYAHHITDNRAFHGPDNQVLLHSAFADHQVTHWSAQVMARTLGADVADMYPRKTGEGEPFTFNDKFEFLAQRDPDVADFWSLPLVGRDAGADYDEPMPGCEQGCRTAKSAFIEFDQGRTAVPPIGNVPPRADDHDPHGFPRGTQFGKCQKSHFLHTQGRIIDVRGARNVTSPQSCPALPQPAGAALGAEPAQPGLADALGNFIAAVGDAIAALGNGDPQGAVNAVVAGVDQLAADLEEALLGGDNPVTPPVATDRLYAGAAEGPTRIPVGTPLGGYLRPPVGGDFIFGNGEDCLAGQCDAFFAEILDFLPTATDHDGVPLAPVPDELRVLHSPYATISPPTRGYYDSLITKAVALRNGDKTVVLVKLDMIGMIDEVVVDVAERVKERTGVDLSDGGLMMSGTHTHDGPGALANHALKFFWVAMDVYQHEVYVRVVDDIAGTVIAALSDMRPARFGYAVGQDTTNSNKYRRGQDLHDQSRNAERDYVRQRIGVLRVDDDGGNPIAAIVNYSAHGIAFDVENQYFSGDVMGSVEREMSYTFDRPVVVMSVQSAGGDVSPNVWRDPSKLQGIERFGKRLAPVIRSVYDRVDNFDDDPVLKSVSQRIVLNRETLGYTGTEYPYEWGAIECNAAPVPDGCLPIPPPDADDLLDNGVAENKAWGPGDTRLTSIRIGDAVLIGQPGEALTEFGRQILDRSPFGRDHTFIWGTSQDHVGYILADNKADWSRGGTEGSTTFWGWKLGTRLHTGYDALNQVLLGNLKPGDAGYPADEFQVHYTNNDVPPVPARTLPSARPGRVITQPSAIQRFAATTFSWEGGDPVVDFPIVEMQRLNEGGQWEAVRRANGTPLNTFFEMHLEYQLATAAHQWLVHFEAPKDWPTGNYRFAVNGVAAIGPVATVDEVMRQDYAVTSDSFSVTESDSLQLSAPTVNAGSVQTSMNYVPRPGNYRIIDINVDPRNPAPVRGGRVTFTNGTDTVVDQDADGDGVYQANISGTVTATGADAFGNTSNAISTLDNDADSDGVPNAADACTDTPAGASVDAEGCSAAQNTDTDGDGVPDRSDQCAGTADGEPVDDTGCSAAQGDADNDGIPNASDVCPNTPGGEPANAEGCGASQLTHASCAQGTMLAGNRSYQVTIPSESGETISFQVLEPASFNCSGRAGGAHPLILHGHGYGGSRSTSGFANYRDAGYAVISIDQRGFGQSTGTVRVMDPDYEGKDLIRILDWAEANLDYLAWRNEATGAFTARPATGASVAGGANLLVGAIGGSYGGGYQLLLHNVDPKNRLDALAPDITWHDLRYSLNPGDVVKSGWDLLLTVGGEAGSLAPGLSNGEDPTRRGHDLFIRETLARGLATNEFPRDALEWFRYHSPTYWCGLNDEPARPYPVGDNAPLDPNVMLTGLAGDVPGSNTRSGQPPVDVLFSQGMRDTLFNFNEAWWNYQCFRARGGDVRLITHQSGHILNNFVNAPVPPLNFQNTGGNGNCGGLNRGNATLQWFGERLKRQASDLLAGTEDAVCLSLADGDAVQVPENRVLAPRATGFPAGQSAYYESPGNSLTAVVQGPLAQLAHLGGLGGPAVKPLLTVTAAGGAIVAGIPLADITIRSPQMANDVVCELSSVPTTRSGCDSIIFIGLGLQKAGAADYVLVDDQVAPVRGLGVHTGVELVGIAERMQAGDKLALLVYGYHPQYPVSYSRDITLPAVDVSADLRLPLYAVVADGNPDFATPAADAVEPIQGGGGFPIELCGPDAVPGVAGPCIDDVPLVGQTVQNVLDTVWNTVMGGGGGTEPPTDVLLDTGDVEQLVADASNNAATLPDDLVVSARQSADNAADGALANRSAEAVIMEGKSFPDWSQPAALGLANPYPSGVGGDGEFVTGGTPFYVRDAHNGTMLYPLPGVPFEGLSNAAPVGEIVAFRRQDDRWIEIPVQVDERFPYFLANAHSGFSFYSGTDMELTYAWDRETWKAEGECEVDEASVAPMADPVPGLDDDDEIVFMAGDAGDPAAATAPAPEGTVGAGQEIALSDPLNPGVPKFVYLYRRPGGPSFAHGHYVSYERDANADQWVDRGFWANSDPEKVGTSNRGYGPNLSGTVCPDGTPASARTSSDRFPRDGVTVSTDRYQVYASGRWMVRNVRIARPGEGNEGNYGADIVDRWKGRAFQQSPDSVISLVGFEDEQVNWEANSALLGERAGPVRAIREIWGADSGTNVTKTETYYRDAYAFRYRVRVHPIPPDGLYTSWDYNRSAMVPGPGEQVPGGRYYTAVRGTGVPIDGVNDDVGQVDRVQPVAGMCITSDGPQPAENYGGVCPLFVDAGDPMLNLPLAMYNWEQVAAKGDLGSLVYMFELKSATIGANAVAMPYYRDDACLDDGTGDDPVARPWPGEDYRWNSGAVPRAYDQRAGRALDHSGETFADCLERQGAHAQHGVHFFAPPESDNAMLPVPVDEIDGQQWAFAVPMAAPTNVGERYANVVRVPLVRVVRPVPGNGGEEPSERGLVQVVTDFIGDVAAAAGQDLDDAVVALVDGANTLVAGIGDLLFGNENASVVAVAEDVVYSPEDAPDDAATGLSALLNGFTEQSRGQVYAGVGVVDMTPDVGYGAGQYSDKGVDGTDGTIDPYATHKTQVKSYGVVSRLTARAIVVEGANGKRIALLKSDNYLAQDNLLRRVGQILAEHGSTIGYDQILYHVTHAHSTTYVSTLSAGVWLFQDAYDARFFENQARKLAEAILIAERNLAPARMGATTVRHKVFKGNIMGPATGDDGTPVQYPREYGDHGLVVMRIETDETQPRPIAAWVNWGEHPEGLNGYDLHSGDFVAFLERFVDRELGAPLVFSQGDVGSAEKSGNDQQRLRDDGTVCEGPGASGPACQAGEGTWRDWNHKGYVQNERNVRFLADAVIKGWKVIGGELSVDKAVAGVPPNDYVPEVQVPLSNAFAVDYRNAWVPGPLSHPYPAISACRSETTVEGNPGVPNAADCTRLSGSNSDAQQIWDLAKAEGLPLPENYDLPSFALLEENIRLKLQVFRLGDVVLGSCACEAQVDLILNFESRANDQAGDIYDGFDWACVAEDQGLVPADPAHAAACALQRARHYDVTEFPTHVPGSLADAYKVRRMRAQVHNDAAGWDAPEYVLYANSEPADPAQIKGNFTKEELPPALGYKLAVGVGHAGDYNGYTVSYREFMSHDHYRKSLTSYGPHTADYMVTRLVRMAGAMRGGAELAPEPLDAYAQVDEARKVAESQAHGAATRDAYEAFYAALPPDAGTATALVQPRDIGYYTAATFTWRGGATAIDNPRVVVERCEGATDAACTGGEWQRHADQTGEVQTRVQWPRVEELPSVYAGQFEWRWTANFEAYEAFPARLGSTPEGVYRFAVEGCINGVDAPEQNLANRVTNLFAGLLPPAVRGDLVAPLQCRGGASPYRLASDGFRVETAAEVVQDVRHDDNGDLVIRVSPTSIPRTYVSAFFPFLRDDGGSKYCKECSFRPWATSTATPSAVTVRAGNRVVQATGDGANWAADVDLADGATAEITVGYADGSFGRPFTYTRSGPGNLEPGEPGGEAPQLCAPDQIPEIGGECLAGNGGEAVQDLVDEAYGALTGGL